MPAGGPSAETGRTVLRWLRTPRHPNTCLRPAHLEGSPLAPCPWPAVWGQGWAPRSSRVRGPGLPRPDDVGCGLPLLGQQLGVVHDLLQEADHLASELVVGLEVLLGETWRQLWPLLRLPGAGPPVLPHAGGCLPCLPLLWLRGQAPGEPRDP